MIKKFNEEWEYTKSNDPNKLEIIGNNAYQSPMTGRSIVDWIPIFRKISSYIIEISL